MYPIWIFRDPISLILGTRFSSDVVTRVNDSTRVTIFSDSDSTRVTLSSFL